MKQQPTVVQVLERARDRIQRGWCKRSYVSTYRGQKNYCAIGAIYGGRVIGIEPNEILARKWLAEAIKEPIVCISEWNDAKERTKAQVLTAFNTAIDMAKKAEGSK